MSEAALDVQADSGYICKQGNYYIYYIITREVYPDNATMWELDINLPMRGSNKFYFTNSTAQEPIEFDVVEVVLKMKDGWVYKVDIREIKKNKNLTNTDLGTYFNSTKTHADKKEREKKYKDKMDKLKAKK